MFSKFSILKNRLVKNSFYNTLGGITRMGLGIITVPLLIHQLGTEEYGLWSLASAVIAVLTLAEAGLSTATTVFVAQDLGKEDVDSLSQTLTATIATMLIMATLAAVFLWFGADKITSLFSQLNSFQRANISKAFQIGGIVVWTRLVQQILSGIEQAYQSYGIVNLAMTAQSLLTNIGMLIIALKGGKTLELMQWQGLASAAMLVVHLLIVRFLFKGVSIYPTWNKKRALEVGKYSSMVWLNSLGSVLFTRCDRFIVGNLLGTQSLGIYATIADINTQINVISALPAQPLISFLGEEFSKEKKGSVSLQKRIEQFFLANSLIATLIGSALITLSPICLNFLFPNRLSGQYSLAFSMCSLIYTMYSMNAVGHYILIGIKEIKTCALISAFSGIFSLTLIAVGSHFFGVLGAILGNSGYILTLLLSVVAVKKLNIPLRILKKSTLLPFVFLIFVVIENNFMSENIFTRLTTFAFQSCALLYWYWRSTQISR
jgi:O-antigen/teichoic acid export membrane protein